MLTPIQISREAFQEAYDSLSKTDESYPEPEVVRILRRPENTRLIEYIANDAFGSHVFPGDHPITAEIFFAELDRELASGDPYFLWATIPICSYHCLYCQFPIVVQPRDSARSMEYASRWVDANLREAVVWLERVPHLANTPIAEFCFFGGTPSLLPAAQLARFIEFYKTHFNFTEHTTIRVEGSPDSLTYSKLDLLRSLGCQKLTFGVQTFDDNLLLLANRLHSGEQAERTLAAGKELGFTRIDGDLIYGLLDQTVAGFEKDVRRMIELEFTGIVVTKLHLRPFAETGTAIAGVKAPWQDPANRDRIARKGHRWPSLGQQYQMRELAVELLELSHMSEYPTMYFQTDQVGCGTWKAYVLDQDKQRPEVGIGLGGSSATSRASANITVDHKDYFSSIDAGVLPLEAQGLDREGEIASSIRRSLSTCQPVRDDLHRARFPESSLFDRHWGPIFDNLENRGLARIDRDAGTIRLTQAGKTLVEAIMHKEVR
jgi:oxygen-independent coproporphyrinogen III oxidase